MFATFGNDRVEIPSFFGRDPGEAVWRNVWLRLFTPYFHVLMSPRNTDADQCSFTVLTTDVRQLQLAADNPDAKIEDVQLVSPGHLNGTGHWRMDGLASIHAGIEAIEDDQQQYALVYVLRNGSRLLDASVATAEHELEKSRAVFVVPEESNA